MAAHQNAGLLSVVAIGLATALGATASHAADPSPFFPLIGWWSGEGRLGFKEGRTEQVKCRATYVAGDGPSKLEQTIRCAAQSGAIEVRASVAESAGKLSGTWSERLHELKGDIDGEINARGFRVSVRSTQLTAGMDIMVRDDRQIVEIQFHDSTLVGLSLLLQKGTSAKPPS